MGIRYLNSCEQKENTQKIKDIVISQLSKKKQEFFFISSNNKKKAVRSNYLLVT